MWPPPIAEVALLHLSAVPASVTGSYNMHQTQVLLLTSWCFCQWNAHSAGVTFWVELSRKKLYATILKTKLVVFIVFIVFLVFRFFCINIYSIIFCLVFGQKSEAPKGWFSKQIVVCELACWAWIWKAAKSWEQRNRESLCRLAQFWATHATEQKIQQSSFTYPVACANSTETVLLPTVFKDTWTKRKKINKIWTENSKAHWKWRWFFIVTELRRDLAPCSCFTS